MRRGNGVAPTIMPKPMPRLVPKLMPRLVPKPRLVPRLMPRLVPMLVPRLVPMPRPGPRPRPGISVHTLRNWEQGRRKPEGPALALLRIAARHPKIVRESAASAA